MARNTTIIRSNYLWDESAAIYEHALKLWEQLPGGAGLRLPVQPARRPQPRAHAAGRAREHSAGSSQPAQRRRRRMAGHRTRSPRSVPIVNVSHDIRYPVLGGTFQPRAGIAKHDHVAWALRPQRADELGVDLIQNCEVTGFVKDGDRVVGVETNRGRINAGMVGLAAAGHSSVLAEKAGFRSAGAVPPSPGAGLRAARAGAPDRRDVQPRARLRLAGPQGRAGDGRRAWTAYNGYGQRGSFHVIEHQMAAAVELFPIFARAHLLRTWGGIVDVTPDASPIIGATPVENLYVNCGWGTGGFKATPAAGWTFAHTIATGEAAPAERALRPRPLHHRRPHRRARRRSRGPLMPRPLEGGSPCC